MAVVDCQNYPELSLGFGFHSGSLISTVTMDAATPTCLAYSFVVPSNPFGSGSCKLLDIRWNCTTATGSPKVTAYLVSDANGVPDVVANALATATETGVLTTGWVTCTFGTPYTLTAGTQYWIVLKCTSGTSAVMTYAWTGAIQSIVPVASVGSTSAALWRALGDSGTGAAWAGTDRYAMTGIRIGLTNDTDTAYFGYPSHSITSQNTAANKVYGTIETGVCFTMPANVTLSVKSVNFALRKAGTPGNVSLKFYTEDATSPTAISNAIPVANVGSAALVFYTFDFATPLTLTGGTKYRFVIAAASGDTSNYYYTYSYTFDSDSVSGGTVNLVPGSAYFTNLTSGAWAAADYTQVPPFALILNTTGRFVAPDFPAVGNVTEDDTVNGVTGTYHEATAAEVQSGVQFGAGGTEYTGSYSAGGGGGMPILGSSVVR